MSILTDEEVEYLRYASRIYLDKRLGHIANIVAEFTCTSNNTISSIQESEPSYGSQPQLQLQLQFQLQPKPKP